MRINYFWKTAFLLGFSLEGIFAGHDKEERTVTVEGAKFTFPEETTKLQIATFRKNVLESREDGQGLPSTLWFDKKEDIPQDTQVRCSSIICSGEGIQALRKLVFFSRSLLITLEDAPCVSMEGLHRQIALKDGNDPIIELVTKNVQSMNFEGFLRHYKTPLCKEGFQTHPRFGVSVEKNTLLKVRFISVIANSDCTSSSQKRFVGMGSLSTEPLVDDWIKGSVLLGGNNFSEFRDRWREVFRK